MKQFLTITAALLLTITSNTQARIWRVNNDASASAHFTSLTSAVNAATAGDTIHLEGSPTMYSSVNLAKRLVIRGTGYFLNEATPNPRTQALKEDAKLSSVTFSPGSKGSVLEGVNCLYVYLNDSLVTIQRNYIYNIFMAYNASVAGDTIRNNYLAASISTSSSYRGTGIFIYNNIIAGGISISNSVVNDFSAFVINNNFVANTTTFNCVNFIFQNNIFNAPDFGSYTNSNIFVNNISSNAALPTGNNNQRSTPMASIYEGWGASTGFSTDGRYKLKPGSPAIGAGVLNGTAVDCGAFGGPAPYILSGMPAMPAIYELNMPTQVNSGTPSINVSVSAAAH